MSDNLSPWLIFIALSLLQSAVIAGLISHLNLITPSWDESNNVTMHVTNVDIGTVEPADPKRPLLCACLVFPGFDVYTCKGQTIYETRNVGFIDKSKCKVRQFYSLFQLAGISNNLIPNVRRIFSGIMCL